MDIRVKAKWLALLRSGEYKQGRGRLMTTHTDSDAREYCCYGVLCDLYRLETGDQIIRGVMAVGNYIPPAVRDWAKLSSHNPMVPDEQGADGFASLAGLNDGGKDFEYIAKKIEENL